MKNSFLLYGHGGSGNHGCEAIIKSTVSILKGEFEDATISLLKQDHVIGKDGEYKLPVEKIYLQKKVNKFSFKFLVAALYYVLTKSTDKYFELIYKNAEEALKDHKPVVFSVGGDNYCYSQHRSLYYLDRYFARKGLIKVLWGCSIEPSSLNDEELLKDLNGFNLIVCRETITFEALKKALSGPEIVCLPDPAFTLIKDEQEIDEEFKKGGIVGLNLSPKVSKDVDGRNITYDNYDKLIKHIISETNHNVLLIPHVVWGHSNDLIPLTSLYEKYKETGRVRILPECSCTVAKGYIANCDMFIGARTHSTIAAYSSKVPCLVVGYSVKAEGIAKDIFGETDHYVIPSKDLEDDNVLVKEFMWLSENKDKIKTHLEEFMPGYIEKAKSAGKEVRKLLK